MKRIRIIADKAADTSLVLLAGAHLMVLAVFLATLIAATSQARGDEMPECKGQDIVAELARDDPALLRTIKAEAAETQNGQGLLWKIEKDGLAPSFLFGTMHMTDPRVTELTPEAHGAFEASSTVVIETTDVLDETKAMAAMLAKPELMLFTDGTKWPSLLSDEDRALATKALAERGIPIQTVQTMKPWILSAMVALPACEIARKTGGAPVLDIKLAQDAEANGKAVAGLETAPGETVRSPRILAAPAAFECRLVQTVPVTPATMLRAASTSTAGTRTSGHSGAGPPRFVHCWPFQAQSGAAAVIAVSLGGMVPEGVGLAVAVTSTLAPASPSPPSPLDPQAARSAVARSAVAASTSRTTERGMRVMARKYAADAAYAREGLPRPRGG